MKKLAVCHRAAQSNQRGCDLEYSSRVNDNRMSRRNMEEARKSSQWHRGIEQTACQRPVQGSHNTHNSPTPVVWGAIVKDTNLRKTVLLMRVMPVSRVFPADCSWTQLHSDFGSTNVQISQIVWLVKRNPRRDGVECSMGVVTPTFTVTHCGQCGKL